MRFIQGDRELQLNGWEKLAISLDSLVPLSVWAVDGPLRALKDHLHSAAGHAAKGPVRVDQFEAVE